MGQLEAKLPSEVPVLEALEAAEVFVEDIPLVVARDPVQLRLRNLLLPDLLPLGIVEDEGVHIAPVGL